MTMDAPKKLPRRAPLPASVKRIYEVYPDKGGGWRWRSVSRRNGQTVGGSQESFGSRPNALRAARQEVRLYPPGVAVVALAGC